MSDEQPKKNKVVQYLKVGGLIYVGLMVPVVLAVGLYGVAVSTHCKPGTPDYEQNKGLCVNAGKAQEKVAAEKGGVEYANAREIELNVGIPCKRLARQMMRDPDSFEAIAINPYNSTPDGKPVNGVVVQYRARNGFGGYGGGSVTCESPTGRMEDTAVVSHSEE